MNLVGCIAIVTGAASGIGRATAFALAEAGAAAVAVADVDQVGGPEAVALLQQRGIDSEFFCVDVTDAAELSWLFAQSQHRFGLIDVVVNNAGVVSGSPAWPETSLARLRHVIDVNFAGVVLGTRLAVEAMRGDGGAVVNVASIAAFGAMAGDPVYAATKAAVVSFTKSCRALAEQLGVRVNAVCPGMTDTAILNKTGDGIEPALWLRPYLSSPELIPPARIAEAIIELLRDDSKAGEYVVVDNPAVTV